MSSFQVTWKVRNTNSSANDSKHSSNVTAGNVNEAIAKVKQNNPATRDRMYDFQVKPIG